MRKWVGQLILRREQYLSLKVDKLFTLFLLLFLLFLRRRVNEGGSNQNLTLFIRGNDMSGAPSIRGTSQFPIPSDHDWYYYEKDYDEGVRCYDYIVDLIISN
jgi:hypothetical protein